MNDVASPETYVGYARQQNYASPQEIAADAPQKYTLPAHLTQNQWGLEGKWEVADEHASLTSAPGAIAFRFHARDLHLVLGPSANGKPIRFRVAIDGAAPGANHGMDTDENGNGVVNGYRLYQLIRQQGAVQDRTFEIQFLRSGCAGVCLYVRMSTSAVVRRVTMDKKILTTEGSSSGVDRRTFFRAAASLAGGLALWHFYTKEPVHANPITLGPPKTVKIVQFSDAGKKLGVVSQLEVVKTDEEWKKQLTPDEYEITRNAGTERPFTGALLNVHDKGIFRCVCCDNALFNANTKFESGTGWPSFWAPIASENVIETSDSTLGMTRTAVSCRLCEAHLGHVFNDGPQPTGLRYCMNSLAMKFSKA